MSEGGRTTLPLAEVERRDEEPAADDDEEDGCGGRMHN